MAGNVSIEGWNGGHDYFCEDDKYHQLKSFKEYVDNHDMEPIPGKQLDTSIYLTKVLKKYSRKKSEGTKSLIKYNLFRDLLLA